MSFVIIQAIIKIKQLESTYDEERKRHRSNVSKTNEKSKREYQDLREKYEKEKKMLENKVL